MTEDDLDAAYGTAESSAGGTLLEPAEDDLEAEPAHWMAPPVVLVPEGPAPWERQRGEGVRSYHAFCHFRDLKVHSCAVAYRNHRRDCDHQPVPDKTDAPKRWRIWSAVWGWVERAELWDADIDRQHREKLVQSQLDARERHARLAQATLSVMSVPVKVGLEATRDPAFMQKLIDVAAQGAPGAYQLFAAIARMAQMMPGVVTMERLALGLTTESVEIEDKREFDVAFANRILADPEAVELAQRLLHRGSGARSAPALGTGASGEPRQVGDGAASEPADEEVGGP